MKRTSQFKKKILFVLFILLFAGIDLGAYAQEKKIPHFPEGVAYMLLGPESNYTWSETFSEPTLRVIPGITTDHSIKLRLVNFYPQAVAVRWTLVNMLENPPRREKVLTGPTDSIRQIGVWDYIGKIVCITAEVWYTLDPSIKVSYQLTFNLMDAMQTKVEQTPTCIVYPNPATNYINIQTQTPSANRSLVHPLTKINIYSKNGNLIRTYQTSENTSQMNVSDLQEGRYILRIEKANMIENRHIQIQR